MFSKDEYAEFESKYLTEWERNRPKGPADYVLGPEIGFSYEAPKESTVEPKEGLRYNKGKIRYSVLSPAAMEAEALVTIFGGMKYDHSNFKKFKATEAEAKEEFIDCMFRHMMKIIRGEDMDPESLQHHAAHICWNANRLIDLHYYGMTHGKDGKDLYQQPYRTPMTPVPTEENFAEIWGMIPHSGGKKAPKKGTQC
jgi:hypothetical protein